MDFWPEFLASSWGKEFVAGGCGGSPESWPDIRLIASESGNKTPPPALLLTSSGMLQLMKDLLPFIEAWLPLLPLLPSRMLWFFKSMLSCLDHLTRLFGQTNHHHTKVLL
ncbi:hypothetical protein R6Q57_000132 [Mikania cordata]